jgi:hypothetical protein
MNGVRRGCRRHKEGAADRLKGGDCGGRPLMSIRKIQIVQGKETASPAFPQRFQPSPSVSYHIPPRQESSKLDD